MPTPEISPSCSALRPRARLLRTLGEELISNEVVAVIELVKNAYNDAHATNVLIRFTGPLEPGKGRIEIIDNLQTGRIGDRSNRVDGAGDALKARQAAPHG